MTWSKRLVLPYLCPAILSALLATPTAALSAQITSVPRSAQCETGPPWATTSALHTE